MLTVFTDLIRYALQLLLQPDYATHDLYDSPRLGTAFLMVTCYAILSAFNFFLESILTTQTIAGGLIIGMFSGFLVYLTWVFLSIIFHFASELLGGLGEFPHALGFVGIAAAPLLVTSLISIILTIVQNVLVTNDPDHMMGKIRLGFSIIGMLWGWPGMLCYFGMKHAERVKPLAAALVTVVVCVGFIAYELLSSDVL